VILRIHPRCGNDVVPGQQAKDRPDQPLLHLDLEGRLIGKADLKTEGALVRRIGDVPAGAWPALDRQITGASEDAFPAEHGRVSLARPRPPPEVSGLSLAREWHGDSIPVLAAASGCGGPAPASPTCGVCTI
jgi:hypothetical protein